MSGFRGRYAPSPSGDLHLGNLCTALVCWLQARLSGGEIVLRMDDLDQPRVKKGSAERIVADLCWLGLDFDGVTLFQTARTMHYLKAFNFLVTTGEVFPCRCSRRDIELAASPPDAPHVGAIYPGTCRPGNQPVPRHYRGPLAWRFIARNSTITFEDQILGTQTANLQEFPGDFVIRRKDGIPAYQLATVVDDGLLGITDVVRGADLLDSTARQLALFDALDYPRPRFWHVPLITDEDGNKLAKRDGADSLSTLKNAATRPEDVIAHLAYRVGLVTNKEAVSAQELVQALTLNTLRDKLRSAGARSADQ